MLDYLSSRENFLEVGEQYSKHMQKNLKDWHQFILFYSDINNARKQKDEDYKKISDLNLDMRFNVAKEKAFSSGINLFA